MRAIVDILMGSTTKDEDFEINELNMSAICEVMNQMMGAASTAMSDFLNRMVNISTPQAFEIGSLEEFVEKYFPSNGMLVVVRFKFSVEDAVESEFMSALSMDLVRELLKGFGIEGEDVGMGAEPEPEPAAQPAAAAEPELSSGSGASLSQEEIEKLMAQNFAEEQAMHHLSLPYRQSSLHSRRLLQPRHHSNLWLQSLRSRHRYSSLWRKRSKAFRRRCRRCPRRCSSNMLQCHIRRMECRCRIRLCIICQAAPEPKTIKTTKPAMPKFEEHATSLNEEQESNLDLLMSVPVDVAVEIGRTRRRVKDILNYTKGSLVVLDRLAGDRADLYVNGKCIAKGDIVVVDDNFGLRIAEIIEPLALEDL